MRHRLVPATDKRVFLQSADRQGDREARLQWRGHAYKQPELQDWAKYSWLIELPQADFAMAGKAITELENSEPLLAVSKLSIRDGGENAQFQQITLSVNTAIMKR